MMTDDSDDLSKLPSSSGAGDSEFYSDGPAVEGETGDSDDAAAPSNSAEPVVKVKTLVEYHLEFLTKHPGEVFFYGCKLCTHRFTSRNSFLIHMKLHDVRKRYPCGVCDKAFDRKFQLVHHLRLHTSDTPFECEVCFLAFSDERLLAEHSSVHTSDKPFECRYCLKGFPQKKALIVHLRMHTGERPFPCEFCERTFTQKAHLQGHMLRIHIPKKKVEYQNNTDMQPTTDKSVLSIFSQMRDRLAVADRLVNNPEIRIDPIITESDIAAMTGQREKLIGCDFCDKKFTYERNKTNHMKKHSGEAHYECDTCQRTFPTRNNLASHLLTHISSGSPFRCDICGREFNMKRNLIMHVKSHNNERPFECPACEKSFKLKYFLELHLTRIHPHIRFEDLPPKKESQNSIQIQKNMIIKHVVPVTTPNKRKQSQPKKVVKIDYESDSNDMSYGEYSSESENDMKMYAPVNSTKFEGVYVQEPKNRGVRRDDYGESKSLQINLPHDLRHVKKMLNVKSTQPSVINESKNISCPLCPVMVSSKAVLAIHMKEHDKTKPHQCTMCDKVYIQQASFEKHMRKHMLDGAAGNNISAIEQDGYRLNYFPQLKAEEAYADSGHVKGDGKKPLECKICRKKYAQPASFEKHMRQHSELEEAKSETMVFNENVYEKLKTMHGLKYTEGKAANEQSGDTATAAPEGGYINPSDFLEVSMDHS